MKICLKQNILWIYFWGWACSRTIQSNDSEDKYFWSSVKFHKILKILYSQKYVSHPTVIIGLDLGSNFDSLSLSSTQENPWNIIC